MKRKIQKLYETSSPSNTKFSIACLSKPDCELYAASDESKEIYIWKRGRETPLINLTGISSHVTSLNLNTNEAELVSGLKGGMIIIWDLESSKVKYTLAGHSSSITTISTLKLEEGSDINFLSASSDGKIKLWDVRSKTASATIKAHSGPIKCLSPSPNGRYLASGSEDGMTRLWDLKANKLVKEFTLQGQGGVNCVEINPYAITLAYGTNDRTIKHWDLERYTLISVTAYDRTPIVKIKFDSTGKNIFSATNESLKYWNVDDEEPKLLYLAEAGWKQLHDLCAVEGQGIYGVGTYGNKIGYWTLPWEAINTNNSQKKTNSDIVNEFNSVNKIIPKKIISKEIKINNNNYNTGLKTGFSQSNLNNIDDSIAINEMSLIGNINPDLSNFILNDFDNFNPKLCENQLNHYNSSNIFRKPQNTNLFKQNGFNIIQSNTKKLSANTNMINKNLNLHKVNDINSKDTTPLNYLNPNENILEEEDVKVLNNNLNSNLDISNIYQSNQNQADNLIVDTIQYENDILSNLDDLLNIDSGICENVNKNDVTLQNLTQNDQTINFGDFNKYLNFNPNESVHQISQTNDLPLIQEINEKHSNYKNVISQRSNSLKTVAKWWGECNISSTINALKLIKDISVVNDFFKFAFVDREDIERIYFSFDNALGFLPLINNLINSKYEVYNVTGCKTGMIILRIFNSRISNINEFGGGDYLIKDDKIKKSNELVLNFDKIFKNSNLKKSMDKSKNNELCKFANSFYTDLEFFLKPYKNKNII